MRNLKKILALVLALVMTMSLVTIANAADFSDKADINYAEAVDVMTAVGVLEGFEDGSFKPGEILTREQAAKIICTMLLGENAEKLGTTYSSFKDVAATRWSAPYIEYCASLGIIAGNGDGTYNPTGKLTGYAFAKMLLTALGYDAEIEGFVGAGWNLKVAAMASRAGILSDISDFIGTSAVTREQAAQMALSTLKAIKVEYVGNDVTVSGPDIDVTVGNNKFSYIVNKTTTDGNIDAVVNGSLRGDGYMQFGEQHFPTLKFTTSVGTTEDDFGRPANSWSLANVTIGNYGKDPAFTYTASMVSGSDSAATKVSKLGLKGYKLAGATVPVYTNGSANATTVASVAAIGDLTANGTVVEVFTSETNADTITAVVVVKTQLMKVDRVKSNSVTLAQVENTGVKVNSVKEDEEGFAALSAMKADDYVLIVPVKATGATGYSVASVSVPQTATGNISKVTVNGSGATTGVALDGTEYKMSAQWSADDTLNTSSVNKNVISTAYLDNYGYAIYVKDVKASTNYILYANTYTSLVDGKLINMVEGYDMSGEKLTLNVGTVSTSGLTRGNVYAYDTTTRNSADYAIGAAVSSVTGTLSAGASQLPGLTGSSNPYFDSSVKFLYPVKNSDGDIISVTVKEGVQKIESSSRMQYIVKDGKIVSVILDNDNEIEVGTDVIYISAITGSTTDANGKKVSVFTAYIDGEKYENCVASKELSNKGFYTYAESDGIYTVKEYTTPTGGKTTSVMVNATMNRYDIVNNTYVTVGGKSNLNAGNATVVDLSGGNHNFSSVKDLAEATQFATYQVSVVYNDNSSSNEKGKVSYIFVLDHSSTTATFTADDTNGSVYYNAECTDAVTTSDTLYVGQTLYVKAATALNKVDSITGGTDLVLVHEPTTATDKAVYSFRVTGNVSTISTSANWYTVTAPSAVSASSPKGGYSATVSTAIAENGDTVTVTVTLTEKPVSGTDTVTLTSVTGGTASTGVTFANTDSVGTQKTITFVMTAANATPALSVNNA